jgi:hypothetical protein
MPKKDVTHEQGVADAVDLAGHLAKRDVALLAVQRDLVPSRGEVAFEDVDGVVVERQIRGAHGSSGRARRCCTPRP